MKILIIARGYPTHKYNLNGIFEFDQAKALAKAGHEVIFVAIDTRSIRRWRKWWYESFSRDGVKVEAINIPCGRIPSFISHRIKEFSLRLLYTKIVKSHGRPDIIHSHFIGMGYISSRVFKNESIPLVHTEHYSGMNQKKLKQYYQNLGNATYGHMNKVITVSEFLRKNIKEKFDINSIVIPNIVDIDLFKYDPNFNTNKLFTFISVGNLLPNKQMDKLIKGFKDAFSIKEEVELYIYGEGPERKHLENLILELGLTDRVFLKGQVDRRVIAEQMKESHCFILASKSETFGVAFIEAMASGLPVITTRCGGPEDFITKKNGIIIPRDDADSLAETMKFLYQNIDSFDRESISKESKERFGEASVTNEILRLYENIAYNGGKKVD